MRVLLLALVLSTAAVGAEKKHPAPALPEVPATLTSEQADAFLARLTDAQVRELLSRELRTKAEQRAAAPQAVEYGFGPLVMALVDKLKSGELDVSSRRAVVAQGSAQLPDALSAGAAQLFDRRNLVLLVFVLLVGIAAAWAVRRPLREHGLEPRIGAEASLAARVSTAALRLALDLVPFVVLVLVTLALAHTATDANTLERTFLVSYVTGAILFAGMALVLRLLLAPGMPALSVLPIFDGAAWFLYRWILALWAVMVFGSLTTELLGLSGEPKAMFIVSLGTLITVMIVAMILAARPLVASVPHVPRLFVRAWPLVAIAYVALLWVLWTTAVLDGQPSRAGAAAASLGILLAFPLLDYWVGLAIADVLGPEAKHHGAGVPLRWAMRALLAVLLVESANEVWNFQFFEWQTKLRHALIDASFDLVAAFAVAVLGWHFIKVVIDRRLEVREVNGVRIEPSDRLRTLLPLARVFLVTGLIAATIMLVLSALGVNIAPLLAGAGIVGLAIGFGAQTLVRDIITGVFLIMDDAFRVGEYILVGNYKGTVESIGLRSVKLRHHRGPIYVVPFGEMRGVQNVSRDWVIMKINVGVTYDSDLEKARKLVKKVGQELAADPEYAAEILAPLKMQGVEEFGDFAIQIRMKIMTKPGEKQFLIKRKAYALIKKAFDANGIKFAFPTVQIAGGGDAAAVAAAATRVPGIAGEQVA